WVGEGGVYIYHYLYKVNPCAGPFQISSVASFTPKGCRHASSNPRAAAVALGARRHRVRSSPYCTRRPLPPLRRPSAVARRRLRLRYASLRLILLLCRLLRRLLLCHRCSIGALRRACVR